MGAALPARSRIRPALRVWHRLCQFTWRPTDAAAGRPDTALPAAEAVTMATRKKLKHATVIGVFATRAAADAALRDLRAAGFKEDQIGLVARNASGKLENESGETYAEEGGVAGAVAGAAGGALVGLGVVYGMIPVVGPVLAVGTLGTVL